MIWQDFNGVYVYIYIYRERERERVLIIENLISIEKYLLEKWRAKLQGPRSLCGIILRGE